MKTLDFAMGNANKIVIKKVANMVHIEQGKDRIELPAHCVMVLTAEMRDVVTQKVTRRRFTETNPKELSRVYRNDPMQFEVLYNEWKRTQQNGSI